MATRDIIKGTDNETLRKTSRVVKKINKHIITLLDDMKETMRSEEGVGLAAPQVGVLRRIIVIEYEDKYYDVINPKILENSGETIEDEGCLSVIDIRGLVKRPENITVEYTDRDGKKCVEKNSGILARIFCHEIDHLNGILFVDKMIEDKE